MIGEALAAKGLVGIGRVTIASRERLVLVEPHGGGLAMFTIRGADEVRAAEYGAKAEADPDMVAVAVTIIERRKAKFDPAAFRDHYQDALRELVDSKLKGVAPALREVAEPSKVISLMDALKRSLAQEAATAEAKSAPTPRRAEPLPIGGNRRCSCRSRVGEGRKTSQQRLSRAPRPHRGDGPSHVNSPNGRWARSPHGR